ncbi:MAG: IclR family transcriptional regulator [Reyranellaceae bacterium]
MSENGDEQVPMVQRTLDLFEAFARADGPMRLSDLAEAIAAPVSSCHALVRTLQARGYLYASDKLIYPTRRLFDAAAGILAADPLMAKIRPVLERIQRATGETAVCGKRLGGDVLYVDVVQGTYPVRFAAETGALKPLHSSSLGKACLSLLKPSDYAKLAARLPMTAVTANTITDRARLAADIELGRQRGFFRTMGENVSDVLGLAVALRLDGEGVGIAVAGPIERMQANEADRLGALREAVAALRPE